MYAIHSSFSVLPFVFLIRSVTEPAPQNSITNWQEKETAMCYDHAWLHSLTKLGLESTHTHCPLVCSFWMPVLQWKCSNHKTVFKSPSFLLSPCENHREQRLLLILLIEEVITELWDFSFENSLFLIQNVPGTASLPLLLLAFYSKTTYHKLWKLNDYFYGIFTCL